MKSLSLLFIVGLLLVVGGCATGAAPRSETRTELSPLQNPLGITDPAYQHWWSNYNPYLP